MSVSVKTVAFRNYEMLLRSGIRYELGSTAGLVFGAPIGFVISMIIVEIDSEFKTLLPPGCADALPWCSSCSFFYNHCQIHHLKKSQSKIILLSLSNYITIKYLYVKTIILI